jgi:hypothetical protein
MTDNRSGPFYRMAQEKRDVGFSFKGTGSKYLGEDIETLLEENRPADRLSRSEATFVSASQDVSKMGLPYREGYLHVVEPVGKFEQRDTAWLGELQKRRPVNQTHASLIKDARLGHLSDEEIAEKYNTGEPTAKPEWEYLTSEAIVLKVDEKPRPVRPNSPFLNAFD